MTIREARNGIIFAACLSGMAAIALTAALSSGCAVAPPPVVTPDTQPPPIETMRVAVTVLDQQRAAVPGLSCELALDDGSRFPCTYNGIQAAFQLPRDRMAWGGQLRLTADGFAAHSARVVTAPDLAEVLLAPAAQGAGETGWLRRDGARLVDEAGRTWQWRGASAFHLAKRVCDGEDVEPWFNDPQGTVATGANIIRVLGMFNGGLGRFVPSDYPRYTECIGQTIAIAAAHRVRVEFVVFADAQDIIKDTSAQQAHLARVLPVIDRWNVVGELCNECPKNGVDTSAFEKPRTAILWSRGSGLGDGDPALPGWDLLTHHSARVPEWPRRIECREYTNNGNSPAKGTPCVEDEPYGAAETSFPGRRVGAEAIEDMTQWGAVCGMHAVGCTFHSDGGIYAQPLGPVQQRLAGAFFTAMRWVPPEAQLWPYQRGEANGGAGIGDMPLEHTDALALRTWCKTAGGQSWCVAVKPTSAWRAQPRAGWRVVEEPARGLVRLER